MSHRPRPDFDNKFPSMSRYSSGPGFFAGPDLGPELEIDSMSWGFFSEDNNMIQRTECLLFIVKIYWLNPFEDWQDFLKPNLNE